MKQIDPSRVTALFGGLATLFPIKTDPRIIAFYATRQDWSQTVSHWVHTTREKHNGGLGWCIEMLPHRDAYNKFPFMVHPSLRPFLTYDFVIVVRAPPVLNRIKIWLILFRIWGKTQLRRRNTPHNLFYHLKQTFFDCLALKNKALTDTLIHELIHVIDHCNHTTLLTDDSSHDWPLETAVHEILQIREVNLKFHW